MTHLLILKPQLVDVRQSVTQLLTHIHDSSSRSLHYCEASLLVELACMDVMVILGMCLWSCSWDRESEGCQWYYCGEEIWLRCNQCEHNESTDQHARVTPSASES